MLFGKITFFFAHKLVMLSNNKIFSYLQIDKIV